MCPSGDFLKKKPPRITLKKSTLRQATSFSRAEGAKKKMSFNPRGISTGTPGKFEK